MSIKESLEKIKPFYNLMVIILVASIFFVLGRISVTENTKRPINIAYPNVSQTASLIIMDGVSSSTQSNNEANSKVDSALNDGMVIGSKSGKKYYFPWCGTVKRIKPENQVKFNSIAEAKKAGFTPGGNCKGLN